MSVPRGSDAVATFLLATYAKAALVFCLAWIVAGGLRKRSAAARHEVWLVSILVALALPLVALVLPSWQSKALGLAMGGLHGRPIPAAGSLASAATIVRAVAGHSVAVLWSQVVLILWAGGLAIGLIRLTVGYARMLVVQSRATILFDGDWMREVVCISRVLGIRRPVRLFRSNEATAMPLAWGVFSPKILIPSAAVEWTEGRRRVVLFHELSHIARQDCAMQIAAEFIRAIYWLNPFAWLAVGRLRCESECACDDSVLNSGVEPAGYADHLLVLARSLGNRNTRWMPALAMARSSQLERRFTAMLSSSIDRRSSSLKFKLLAALAAACLLIPLAAIRLPAQAESGKISGTIYDPSGAAVPNATIIMIGQTDIRDMTTSDASGAFEFTKLPAGRYEMEVLKPGFKTYMADSISLAVGTELSEDATLDIGEMQERVEVQGQGVPSSNPETENLKRIRIGGSVEAAKLFTQVMPVYPEEAKAAGSQGTVILRAVIGKDGTPLSLHVVNGEIDPLLARSAVQAVSHWRYRPTLLNGEPVEVATEISVVYTLKP